jgi:formylglycine-generating enzyme required for sulfatase activity
MIRVEGKERLPAFYIDRSPVSYHSYHEFLKAVADRVRIEDGVVKYRDDIWIYLGDGTAPYEQIAYHNGRFILRDAAWASRPVVRVTFLGARAYARHYNKRLPSLQEWRAGLALLNDQTRRAPAPTEPSEKASIKEWLAEAVARDSAEAGGDSADIYPLLAAWPLSEAGPPQKRYPWEGFADAGFRTVIEPVP